MVNLYTFLFYFFMFLLTSVSLANNKGFFLKEKKKNTLSRAEQFVVVEKMVENKPLGHKS